MHGYGALRQEYAQNWKQNNIVRQRHSAPEESFGCLEQTV
jgi:hypothetical protein